ncbi:BACON domain-containing protein [Carboxylicivirga linearis]|uniref:BACON domain-containing protein n=1 Tax=Carboxylicivirga linearis TaxID=1628157 RepID=A0ABS5JSN0_9BACT|nr:hypothetical protein [Carboxylicivirga linearis]MBS2097908.1 hypothetical protein [Carboxylicivirga linearis]
MKTKLFVLISLLTLLVISCGEDEKETVSVDIQILASPDTLLISDSELKEIFLTTQPKGKVDFVVSQSPSWLELEIESGQLDGSIMPIEVSPVIDNLDEGVYEGDIDIVTDAAGKASVHVILDVAGHPNMGINVDKLVIDEDSPQVELVIENIGTGVLEWQFEAVPEWINVSVSQGYLTKGEKSSVIVTGIFTGLDVGTHSDVLNISSNSETSVDEINVEINVPEYLAMEAISSSLLFDYYENTKLLVLRNTGNAEINWSLLSIPAYLNASITSGAIAIEDSVKIEVEVDRSQMSNGEHLSEIIIEDENQVQYKVETIVKHMIGMEAVNNSLFFDYFDDTQTLILKNIGSAEITWSLVSIEDYLNLSSTSGTIAVGDSVEIEVVVDRDQMSNGEYESEIIFEDQNQVQSKVEVLVNNYASTKKMLDYTVVDAEYSKITNKLIFVSSEQTICVYDPDTEGINSLSLSYLPTCVSVSLDGSKAAVGHDGKVSYVDLASLSLVSTRDISCSALDIVLGNNNWAYIFPIKDQWENIRCIDLDDENSGETLHTGNSIYAGTKAKLHPSGKYIYGADNGLSPSDLEKYDIQSGTAAYLYDSPYHGDYNIGGDLWFSEDGLRVFTKGGTVFKTSEIKEQDMLYNGTIQLESEVSYYNASIESLDHSEASKSLFVISSGEGWDTNNKPYLYVYNSDNLVFKERISLEGYMVEDNQGSGTVYEAEPFFVFSNSNGTKAIVLTKAIGSGMIKEWAIQTFDINN